MQSIHLPLRVIALTSLALPISGLAAGSSPGGLGRSAVPEQPVLLAGRGGGASTSAEAAEQARRQTGGKVLSVSRSRGGYQVKVLTPKGEIRVVHIPGSGG